MTRFLSGYWLLVPLLLFAIVVRNWIEAPETLVPDEPLTMQRLQADYYLEDFTTRRFDEDGQLQYLLSGQSLSHYPQDDRAEIVEPRLQWREPDLLWSMRASGGRLTRSPDVVTLLDDVVLHRAPLARAAPGENDGGETDGGETDLGETDAGKAPRTDPTLPRSVTITTSDLSIALDSRDVSTERGVVIEAPGMRLEATGLQASSAQGKLELLSNVTGRYEVVPRAVQ